MLPRPSMEDLASILQLCRPRSQAITLRLHGYITKMGLARTALVGNELVMSLAYWGLLSKARQIFDRLLYRKEYSWSSLIYGYVHCERPYDALELYHQKISSLEVSRMRPQTVVAILKASAKLKNVNVGLEMHAVIDRMNLLDHNCHVASALLVMYAKCGFLHKAREIFDKLSHKNVVNWTALIAGYVEHGCCDKALQCFDQMQAVGICPTAVTFTCTLKACSSTGNVDKGKVVHCEVARRGLQRDTFVSVALIDMYIRCTSLIMGREVFDGLPFRSLVAWNILITGYAEFEYVEEVFACFERLQVEGIRPDVITLASVLKACSSIGDIDKGIIIHIEMARHGPLIRDLAICNSLTDMYAKCGQLTLAQKVFDEIPAKDIVSWTVLITGYADHGLGNEALYAFEQMQLSGFSPNDVSLISCLKACGITGDVDKGLYIHTRIEKLGVLTENSFVGNILVHMYSQCGLLTVAQNICKKLQVQNEAAWNAVIAGYVNCGYGEEAMDCLSKMQDKGATPDGVTFMLCLKAAASIQAIGIGRRIHGEIERQGLMQNNCMLANTLISMYTKCGLLSMAQQIYSNLKEKDAVSKTSLLSGYMEHGHQKEILDCIETELNSECGPDVVMLICCLKACGRAAAGVEGQKFHFELERRGMLEKDASISNTLIDMYSKLGLFGISQQLFNRMSVRDVVSWTVLIASYIEQELGEEALQCFEKMQLEGVPPSSTTFIFILKACAIVGAELKVQEIFSDIERQGLDENVEVANTLISAYAKLGLLARAQYVFDKISNQNIFAWNALMAGYGIAGKIERVFSIFSIMLGEGPVPDLKTFSVVLNAFARKGILSISLSLFESMRNYYGLIPTLEHHTCMVDILGQTGNLDKAILLIKKMPFSPDTVVWDTVLGACRHWGDEHPAKEITLAGLS